MICPRSIAVVALAAMFLAAAAWAHDETKYPDWSGQWLRTGGIQSDPTRPIGRGQQAPLTPEYQAIFEASLADQAVGGASNDANPNILHDEITTIDNALTRPWTVTKKFRPELNPT